MTTLDIPIPYAPALEKRVLLNAEPTEAAQHARLANRSEAHAA